VALTPKQQAFVDAYSGNGTAAARAAGYKGSDATLAQVASENLRRPEILSAIQARNQVPSQVRAAVAQAGIIATRAERQAFWTATMLDVTEELSARLKASELLGKSEADFMDRVKHEGQLTLEQLVLTSARKPEGG
jgi:phage terminase small subunit